MRTTITLEDDVLAKLKRKMGEGSGKTFKEVVNETLRHGLLFDSQRPEKTQKPFKVKAKALGMHPHINYSKASDLEALMDEEYFAKKLGKR